MGKAEPFVQDVSTLHVLWELQSPLVSFTSISLSHRFVISSFLLFKNYFDGAITMDPRRSVEVLLRKAVTNLLQTLPL